MYLQIGSIVVAATTLLLAISPQAVGQRPVNGTPRDERNEQHSVAADSIPGGIVYSDGKDAWWYDFGGSYDNKPVNLTEHIPDISVDKQAFAVSESGQTLVWLQGYKFWSMDLPKGTPRPFQMELWGAPKGTRTNSTSFASGYRDILWQRAVRNIAISPDESKVMFESVHNGLAWTYERMLTDPIPLQKAKDPSYRPDSDPLNPMLPFFVAKPASCIGIFAMSKDYNQCDAPGNDPYAPRYGNVCEWPPVPKFRLVFGDTGGRTSIMAGETQDAQGRIYPSRGVAKSAFFPAFQSPELWQKQKMMAFIFRLPNGQWGPIELRIVDNPTFDRGYDNNPDIVLDRGTCGLISQEFMQLYPRSYRSPGHSGSNCPVESKNYELDAGYYQPRQWEIQIPALQSCNGIAWTPEGSLTILDDTGRLYKISAQEIQRAQYQGTIVKNPNGLEKGSFFLYPSNNMIRATPELIGSDINGSNLCWISEQEFVFLGKDNCVYRYSKAGKHKIAGPLPGKFFYCQTSPLKSANAATSGKGEFCVKLPKDQKSSMPSDYGYRVGIAKLGYIALNVKRYSTTINEATGKAVPYSGPAELWVGKIGCQPPLEYCLTDRTGLGQIKYTADGYKFYYNYGLNARTEHIAVPSMTGAEGDRPNEASLPPGKVMLLRLDKQYVIEVLMQRHPSKEATFTYEWRTITEPAANVSLASILSQGRQTGVRTQAAKPARLAEDSKDADLPILKATFQRSFSEKGMKFVWERQGQHNEIVVLASCKEEFDDTGSHTNIPKITVLADKAIEDIDLSGYKPRDYTKDPIVSSDTLDFRKNVPLGGVLLVQWKGFHIALRPLSVDGKTITYKRRLFE